MDSEPICRLPGQVFIQLFPSDEYEVNEILRKGRLNTSRIRRDERGATYPLEGITRDKQRVRIVVAPRKNGVEVITCIDLDTDWPCDCP